MNKFQHKKIGIWGFGVVGSSALEYFDQHNVQQIEILDTKEIVLPTTQTPTIATLQTDASIQNFLENNDYILASPGIKLHNYQQFAHKFINELDELHKKTDRSIIAITGTVGKTSITHLLENIIKATFPNTIAAGNIGYPMLKLIDQKDSSQNCTVSAEDLNEDWAASAGALYKGMAVPAEALCEGWAVIELSSFQLQPIQKFAPDLAIITNFFANHLDHHLSIEEYFDAKCNIIKHQTDEQFALIPLDLADDITKKFPHKKNWAFFSAVKPAHGFLEKFYSYPIYFLENKKIYCLHNNQTQEIFDCNTLPPLTFEANWLIIVAACHLTQISLTTIANAVAKIQLPDHRLQKVGTKNGSTFYNDSKSTVWQATLQAIHAMDKSKPIKLFLGGLSKGADRTPLLQALENKNIEILAFGKEAEQIGQLCKQFNIKHQTHATLDSAFATCIENLHSPHEILFSPGGSSFDLFADYKVRGQYFTQLVQNFCKN